MRRHTSPAAARRPATGLALGLCLLGVPLAASATIDERLSGLTPLVLKDGRIANVTVHTIPFATGAAELDAATAAELEALFRPLATDCFLTAQAIGHVAPGISRDGDTLAAHRLARARADGIQKALAGFGMPEPAVASVWDWQFLVEASQVTLWVFSLNVGDDCEGMPLPIEAPALAAAPAPELPAAESAPTVTTGAAEQLATAAAPAADALAAATPEPEATPPAEVALDAPRELALVAPPNTDDAAGDATQAVATASVPTETPAEAGGPASDDGQRDGTAAVAALPVDPLATAAVAPATAASDPAPEGSDGDAATDPETVVAAIDPTSTPSDGSDAAPALAIVFDVNSSFFPAGASRQLRAFIDGLPAAAPVVLELAGAVGSGAVRGASDEEAARYNAWMAERRIQRVREWLEQHAGDRPITVTERLVANDPSREVRLYPTVERD